MHKNHKNNTDITKISTKKLDYLLHMSYNKNVNLCSEVIDTVSSGTENRAASLTERAKGHLETINRHKLLVMKYCFKAGLYKQGLLHDLSKYSPAEFFSGVKYFQGDKSPNTAERAEKGYSLAWLHHKGRNRHHMEYWIDYGQTGDKGMTGLKMPEKYVVEMFCDRIAACKVYHGDAYTDADPYNYYKRSHSHYMIHPETDKLLRRLLLILRDYGEEKAFAYIRRRVLRKG